ncbi:MAG TPA: CcoQ/FixQ family Cbb3-type cytochrome c oxidase assembly chaperone [Burkholderiales bacterium]|jgi:cbb3-type cytochrome oxidase subunit 3|nr:CcoQ/FixQ family Cbb3-type cytochrome c oxidase assembly chaperone [Burkholderiales bacterium]
MDVNQLRIVITLLAFAAFVWIVVWAYLPSRKRLHEQEARRILEDRDP